MNIWALCKGDWQKSISVQPWRVVESQYLSSSRDLVDHPVEHDLLESLLEASKPSIKDDKHYLIFTPFRYPPLKYGSRFGQSYECSLWYGSLELTTAFAEVSYYRLQFFKESSANLGYIETPMTAFQAFLSTSKGIDLTLAPFDQYEDKISRKFSYEYSQPLGTSMREAGIEAFLFNSARTKNPAVNLAAYTVDVFKKHREQYIHNQQNWLCISNKNGIEFTRLEILNKERLSFSFSDF